MDTNRAGNAAIKALKACFVSITIFLIVSISVELAAGPSYPFYALAMLRGTGRLLRSTSCDVLADSVRIPGAKCFAMEKNFDGHPVDGTTILLPSENGFEGYAYVVVWRIRRAVGGPNSSLRDYRLISENVLFQSESGSIPVDFYKGEPGPDGQLAIHQNQISFRLPLYFRTPYDGKTIQVITNTGMKPYAYGWLPFA